MPQLTYQGKQFYLDGKPIQILSGAMHYFRIPEEYWYDRLLKLKECGFNAVETYTCWNLHEPKEGEFDFSGILNVEKFIRTAAELGLYVILRPGPYICAEWECGGLPSWLLTYKDMKLRCYDPVYLSKVERYFTALLTPLLPYFGENGGNILMLQVENEYGSYGSDKLYLQAIKEMYEKLGAKALYFTSDGACHTMLRGGTLPDCVSVANFGSKPDSNFKAMERFRPDQPFMCGEYWNGWFSQWGCEPVKRPYQEVISDFKEFLDTGASINMYMFHGGTNFGFLNGANRDGDKTTFTVTSYDYGAPLSEAGDRTPMYYALREALGEKVGQENLPPLTAKDSEKKAYGQVTLTKQAALFDNLERIGTKHLSRTPLFMEEVGQDFGFILYRAHIEGPNSDWRLCVDDLRDRAVIFVNGEKKAIYDRNVILAKEDHYRLPLDYGESATLDVLVENMGRINYGPFMADTKGASRIRFSQCQHHGWEIYSLPMTGLDRLALQEIGTPPTEDAPITVPTFFQGEFTVEGAPCDTFLRLDGFTKGFVLINGINIGRFWEIGPQKTLYVPAPFLKEGKNEILVYENEKTSTLTVSFTDTPELEASVPQNT